MKICLDLFFELFLSIIHLRAPPEILSPSIKRYDKEQKFELYKAIPSLKEYILADTERIYVEAFRRNEQGQWQSETYNQPEQWLVLPFVELSVSLQDIYADTALQTKE